MYRALSDLRFLRVAVLLEQTLERYEEFLRSLVPYGPVRERLAPIFKEGPGHLGLATLLKELEAATRDRSGEVAPQEALQAILDCESFAHSFYLSNLDRLSDPRLVRLFRTLADEERQHMSHVGDAIAMLGGLEPRSRKTAPGGGPVWPARQPPA